MVLENVEHATEKAVFNKKNYVTMKKSILLKTSLVMLFCFVGLLIPQKLSAQSTVYFFMKKINNLELDVYQNSKPVFDMFGPITKSKQVKSSMVLPLRTQAPCKRKSVFQATGKTIFSIDATFTNPVNAKTMKYAAEIQLNLIDGATYYVSIKRKGLNDLKMELLSDKEAEKMLKDKKYVALPDYDDTK